MKLLNDLSIKFEQADWSVNLDFALIDTILESNLDIYKLLAPDITKGLKLSIFGRKDTPSVEQIIRAAIFKEIKGLSYRELEYSQKDSRICYTFLKLEGTGFFSFRTFHKYISKIKSANLHKFLVLINTIGICEDLEDLQKLRQDSTVVKTNIHYPTNNSLIWDCIKSSNNLLSKLSSECEEIRTINYTKSAKKIYYKINNTQCKFKDKKLKLFKQQLITLTKYINQVSYCIKAEVSSTKAYCLQLSLKELLPLMFKVYDFTYKIEILGQGVKSEEKLFSIYELHTDIIKKGFKSEFGHKINLAGGTSNLILDCQILRGNPSDTKLYQSTIQRIINNYGIVPRDVCTDGGYASLKNIEFSKEKGITNIVFNKVIGSLKNFVSSKNIETRLKKWRSGIEAVISNFKRGYDMSVCNWKGWEHFNSKVLWSAIAYNIRVMTALVIGKIKQIEIVT